MSTSLASAENPYPVYFKEVEDAQEARKTAIEARAAALIAVSGTVVTLLLAIAGLGTKADATFRLTDDARWYLYAALIALAASSVLAIAAGVPLFYRAVLGGGLRWILDQAWDEPPSDATQRIAATRVIIVAWNKRVNDIKAAILLLALATQVAAVVFLVFAAWNVLSGAPLAP